jgi:hypothetical protein
MTTRSVLDKLGYRPGTRAAVIDRPADVPGLDTLPDDATPVDTEARFLVAFVADAAAIARHAPALVERYLDGGHLWLAYPKKTGRIRTDISRDAGWEPLLTRGLLPVTQVAIDDTWSALRFRRRGEIAKLTRTF